MYICFKQKRKDMNYDDWKTQTPDSYDYEDSNECSFCGECIEDGETHCSKECYIAEIND